MTHSRWRRAEKETLDSPELAALLEKFEVLAVDLDEAPLLGSFCRTAPTIQALNYRGFLVG